MTARPGVAMGTVLAAVTLALAGCGDDDADGGDADLTPPSPSGQLPPEFVECMADQGIDVESSPDAMHSPEAQEALQACFGSLHSGGEP
jgi:hypothetical protein